MKVGVDSLLSFLDDHPKGVVLALLSVILAGGIGGSLLVASLKQQIRFKERSSQLEHHQLHMRDSFEILSKQVETLRDGFLLHLETLDGATGQLESLLINERFSSTSWEESIREANLEIQRSSDQLKVAVEKTQLIEEIFRDLLAHLADPELEVSSTDALITAQVLRAEFLLHAGKPEEAGAQLREARRLATQTGSRRALAATLGGFGEYWMAVGDLEGAQEALSNALELMLEMSAPDQEILTLYAQLASVHRQLGEYKKSIHYYKIALGIITHLPEQERGRYLDVMRAYIDLLEQRGSSAEADRVRQLFEAVSSHWAERALVEVSAARREYSDIKDTISDLQDQIEIHYQLFRGADGPFGQAQAAESKRQGLRAANLLEELCKTASLGNEAEEEEILDSCLVYAREMKNKFRLGLQ